MAKNPPIQGLAVVNYVHSQYTMQLNQLLMTTHCHILEFNGSLAHNKPSFLQAISEQLLPNRTASNWSDFADLWRDNVWNLDSDWSALVWTEAHQMLQGGLADLIDSLDILTSISRELYQRNRMFVTFLVGDNINFPPLTLEQQKQ